MLARTCARYAFRRAAVCLSEVKAAGSAETTPVPYIRDNLNDNSLRKNIIEGIGYPGQKHSWGGLTTYGRVYYGPDRYDYGRPKMPDGWAANYFFPIWEFCHICFVADRWFTIRWIRHFATIGICFFPMYLQMKWNVQLKKDFKKAHP